jgi:general secretion pathway protein D
MRTLPQLVFAVLALMIALPSASAWARAPEPSRPAPARLARTDSEAAYTFAFQNAEIPLVAQEIFGALGVPYIVDPAVTGKITFRIEQRLTKAQLLQAFEAALAANEVALVRDGESVLVTPKARARAAAAVRPAGGERRRLGYEVVAAPLSYASAAEVAKALDAISGAGSVVYADDRLGLLVLGGGGQELESALEAIKIFDQSGLQGARIRWFDLANASAATVADEIEALVRAARLAGVTILPLKRLNGLLVFGQTEKTLNEIAPWVMKLDAPARDTVSGFWLYHPRNTSAETLSRTVGALIGVQGAGDLDSQSRPEVSPVDDKSTGAPSAMASLAKTSAGASGAADPVRVAVDKDTNTLVIAAPIWRWLQIQRMLTELDRPQSQILIEASVLEVTLGDNFRFGVDWNVFGNDHHIQASSIGNRAGAVVPTYPGFSVTFLDTDVQAAVSALGSRTSVEVVSAPKIITLDNRTAHLQVGDQVPVVTQTSQSTATPNAPVINNVDYRNSGVILSVTPRISGADRIVLQITQEVSSVVQTDTSGIDSPTIQQRKFESTLTLQDGGVVALGGLISRTRNRGATGVPGLKDIPGLGRLFKTANNDGGRTELIVLLRAKVMTEPAQAKAMMAALIQDMVELRARGLLDAAQ